MRKMKTRDPIKKVTMVDPNTGKRKSMTFDEYIDDVVTRYPVEMQKLMEIIGETEEEEGKND